MSKTKEERIAFLIERIKGMLPATKQIENKEEPELSETKEDEPIQEEAKAESKVETIQSSNGEPKEIKEETKKQDYKEGGIIQVEPIQEEAKSESKAELKKGNGSFESQFTNTLSNTDPLITFDNIVGDIQKAPPLYGGNIIISLKTIKEYINKTVNNITPK